MILQKEKYFWNFRTLNFEKKISHQILTSRATVWEIGIHKCQIDS